MGKERKKITVGGTQIPVSWLSKISTSTRKGYALLILLIVIVIGFLIYFLMSSAIFKPESFERRPKAEKKMDTKIDTEEQFIAAIEGAIDKGEDINAEQNRNKRTLLHMAAKKGYAKAVKLLIDNQADINARDVMDATPLHDAVLADKVEIVKILIANGADLNATSNYLSTPLLNAADCGKVEIAKLLLENGADVNAKKEHGHTPLKAALTSLKYEHIMEANDTTPERQRKIVELLRSYGGKE